MLVIKLKQQEEATVYLENHRLAIVKIGNINSKFKSGMLLMRTGEETEKYKIEPGDRVFKQLTPDYFICFSIFRITPSGVSLGVTSSEEVKIYRNSLLKAKG